MALPQQQQQLALPGQLHYHGLVFSAASQAQGALQRNGPGERLPCCRVLALLATHRAVCLLFAQPSCSFHSAQQ